MKVLNFQYHAYVKYAGNTDKTKKILVSYFKLTVACFCSQVVYQYTYTCILLLNVYDYL